MLPCSRSARRTCAARCGRAGRRRPPSCAGTRPSRCTPPERKAAGAGIRLRWRPRRRRYSHLKLYGTPAYREMVRQRTANGASMPDSTITLPPGPATPRWVQGTFSLIRPNGGLQRLSSRYGDAFTLNIPVFGRTVVLANPAEVRQLLQSGPEVADNMERNLGRVLGPGSLFALSGERHRSQRKLLTPPFHGRRLAAYQRIVEQEAERELATWPDNKPFATLPSTMRITLNAILRAVFGTSANTNDDVEAAQLRSLLPDFVKLGSRLAVLPIPDSNRPWNPWRRFRGLRAEYDAIVARLIAKAESAHEERDDVLALMLRSRYEDGGRMTRQEIADELLTLLTAGHETTATSLAWAIERLRRHPEVLERLADDADDTYLAATITEVQRTRPVIDLIGRQITGDPATIGRWTLPKGCAVAIAIALMHKDERLFPDPDRFSPDRFVGARPDLYQWIPFGGGTRRCLGAAFATMELTVVLKTIMRDFTLVPTQDKGERWHSRGVANAPAHGGIAVVRRRATNNT